MCRFVTVRNEVDGIGTCDAGSNTLGKSTDFIGVGGVPFGTFVAA